MSPDRDPWPPPARRGFGGMPQWRRREISRAGGKAAHRKGTAHQWTHEEAQEAGRKGGAWKRRPTP